MNVHVQLAAATAYVTPDAMIEAPHSDAGYLSLQASAGPHKGQYVSVDEPTMTLKWSNTTGSWERWVRNGQSYVHICEHGGFMVLPAVFA